MVTSGIGPRVTLEWLIASFMTALITAPFLSTSLRVPSGVVFLSIWTAATVFQHFRRHYWLRNHVHIMCSRMGHDFSKRSFQILNACAKNVADEETRLQNLRHCSMSSFEQNYKKEILRFQQGRDDGDWMEIKAETVSKYYKQVIEDAEARFKSRQNEFHKAYRDLKYISDVCDIRLPEESWKAIAASAAQVA